MRVENVGSRPHVDRSFEYHEPLVLRPAPFCEGPLTFTRRLPGQQVLDTDILAQVGPGNPRDLDRSDAIALARRPCCLAGEDTRQAVRRSFVRRSSRLSVYRR